jgi:hypothetical protein
MKTVSETVEIQAPAQEVFAHIDDIRNVGWHMTEQSSMATKYVANREKVWRTIGEPRLLIMASYEMRLAVEPQPPSASRLTISIAYELPRSQRVLEARSHTDPFRRR